MSTPNKFAHDYLVFDDFGLSRVLCMACGSPVRSRQDNVTERGIVRDIAKHPDYREIPVMFEDGTLSFLMVCDACRNLDVSEYREAITRQIDTAMRAQLAWEGKPTDIIDEFSKRSYRVVLRRAETSEVVHAMTGDA